MKAAAWRQKRAVLSLTAVLLLSACGHLPFRTGEQAQQFHPLDSEVAQMAAPEEPKPANVKSLHCRIGRGNAHFQKGWYDYVPPAFNLNAGARITIPVARKKGSEKIDIMGFYDAEGQKLIFCPVVEGPPDKRIACASLYAMEDDLAAGIKRTFDVPSALRGGEITCAYAEEKLQKI